MGAALTNGLDPALIGQATELVRAFVSAAPEHRQALLAVARALVPSIAPESVSGRELRPTHLPHLPANKEYRTSTEAVCEGYRVERESP